MLGITKECAMHNKTIIMRQIHVKATADPLLQVYLVDYGLAYRYRPDGQHKEYKEDPRSQHDGTLAFTSIDAHKGVSEFSYTTVNHCVVVPIVSSMLMGGDINHIECLAICDDSALEGECFIWLNIRVRTFCIILQAICELIHLYVITPL